MPGGGTTNPTMPRDDDGIEEIVLPEPEDVYFKQRAGRRTSMVFANREMVKATAADSHIHRDPKRHSLRLAKRLGLAWTSVVLWIVVGGLVFTQLEGPKELEMLEALSRLENTSDNITSTIFADLDTTAKRELTARLEHFDAMRQFRFDHSLCTWPDIANPNWSFQGSSYFSVTLFTTVGYGSFAPETHGGRAFAIFYSLVGFLIYGYANMVLTGVLEEILVSFVVSKLARNSAVSTEKSMASMEIAISIETACFTIWLMFMAWFYSWQEQWTFSDGVYFSFVTMTTIGLGDFTPGDFDVVHYPFIFMGLAIMGMFLHTVTSFLMAIQAGQRKLKRTRHAIRCCKAHTAASRILRCLASVLILFAYTIFGGGVLHKLEYETEKQQKEEYLVNMHNFCAAQNMTDTTAAQNMTNTTDDDVDVSFQNLSWSGRTVATNAKIASTYNIVCLDPSSSSNCGSSKLTKAQRRCRQYCCSEHPLEDCRQLCVNDCTKALVDDACESVALQIARKCADVENMTEVVADADIGSLFQCLITNLEGEKDRTDCEDTWCPRSILIERVGNLTNGNCTITWEARDESEEPSQSNGPKKPKGSGKQLKDGEDGPLNSSSKQKQNGASSNKQNGAHQRSGHESSGPKGMARQGSGKDNVSKEGRPTRRKLEKTTKGSGDGEKKKPQADGGKIQPQADGEKKQPQADGGKIQPQADGGKIQPQADWGKKQPQADGGKKQPQADWGKKQPQAVVRKLLKEQNLTGMNQKVMCFACAPYYEGSESYLQLEPPFQANFHYCEGHMSKCVNISASDGPAFVAMYTSYDDTKILQKIKRETKNCTSRCLDTLLSKRLEAFPCPPGPAPGDRMNWAWPSASAYAMSLFTTVGYGNFSVSTDEGKGFLVVYALFGLLLCGVVSAHLATEIQNCMSTATIYARQHTAILIRQLRQRKSNKVEAVHPLSSTPATQPAEFYKIVPSAKTGILVFVLGGFVVLHVSGGIWFRDSLDINICSGEMDMTMDGVWWSFVATSSIGLGDQVPHSDNWAMLFNNFLYLIVGLVIVGLIVSHLAGQYAKIQQLLEIKAHAFELSNAEIQEQQAEIQEHKKRKTRKVLSDMSRFLHKSKQKKKKETRKFSPAKIRFRSAVRRVIIQGQVERTKERLRRLGYSAVLCGELQPSFSIGGVVECDYQELGSRAAGSGSAV